MLKVTSIFEMNKMMANEKGVESMLEKEKVGFIKIEGKVSSETRKTLVDRFQHNYISINTMQTPFPKVKWIIKSIITMHRFQTVDSVKVALLSITVQKMNAFSLLIRSYRLPILGSL